MAAGASKVGVFEDNECGAVLSYTPELRAPLGSLGERMYIITKQFEFSASHRIQGLPEGHKCGRDHGPNYVVEVELQREDLNHVGFVQDYGDLDGVKKLMQRLITAL